LLTKLVSNGMNNNKKLYLGLALVVILVLGLGYYIYRDITASKVEIDDVVDGSIEYEHDGVKYETLPLSAELPDAPIPSLTKPLDFGDETNKEFIDIMTVKINNLRDSLKDDPTQFRQWMEIAGNYKIIEDYKSAEEAWQYALLMTPGNYVVLGNLANLYAYYLVDVDKAEDYFKMAVDAGPAMSYLYFQASDFYRNVKKDMAKAIEVVELGLQRNPGSEDLEGLLEALKTNNF